MIFPGHSCEMLQISKSSEFSWQADLFCFVFCDCLQGSLASDIPLKHFSASIHSTVCSLCPALLPKDALLSASFPGPRQNAWALAAESAPG